MSPIRRYVGTRGRDGAVKVLVNGRPLDPRLDLYNHSPLGFEWGYGGSGPAQLALAILADHLRNHPDEVTDIAGTFDDVATADHMAIRLHQAFKFAVIACWPRGKSFEITDAEVTQTIAELENRR